LHYNFIKYTLFFFPIFLKGKKKLDKINTGKIHFTCTHKKVIEKKMREEKINNIGRRKLHIHKIEVYCTQSVRPFQREREREGGEGLETEGGLA
jgi:hypothetical protein